MTRFLLPKYLITHWEKQSKALAMLWSRYTKQVLSGGPRLGTYYMETGSGERAASVIYDQCRDRALLKWIIWNGR